MFLAIMFSVDTFFGLVMIYNTVLIINTQIRAAV